MPPNLIGRLVKTFSDKVIQAGENKVEWNVTNELAGVYFLKLDSENYSETKKIIVEKQ